MSHSIKCANPVAMVTMVTMVTMQTMRQWWNFLKTSMEQTSGTCAQKQVCWYSFHLFPLPSPPSSLLSPSSLLLLSPPSSTLPPTPHPFTHLSPSGMFAIRAEREFVISEDFMKAVRKVSDNKKLETKMDYKTPWTWTVIVGPHNGNVFPIILDTMNITLQIINQRCTP